MRSPVKEALQGEEAVGPGRVVAQILGQHLGYNGQLVLPGVKSLCDGRPVRPGVVVLGIIRQAPPRVQKLLAVQAGWR